MNPCHQNDKFCDRMRTKICKGENKNCAAYMLYYRNYMGISIRS
jgi:hypothetical protein